MRVRSSPTAAEMKSVSTSIGLSLFSFCAAGTDAHEHTPEAADHDQSHSHQQTDPERIPIGPGDRRQSIFTLVAHRLRETRDHAADLPGGSIRLKQRSGLSTGN